MDQLPIILTHTPRWVWLLLALLLLLGWRQTRPRRVAPWMLLPLPAALGVLGWSTLREGFAQVPAAAALWGLSVLAATWWMQRQGPGRAAWHPHERRLHLPGSIWPLAVMVGVFALRYASAVAQALHPAWRSTGAVQLPLALLFGTISGLLLGRTWALLRLSRPAVL